MEHVLMGPDVKGYDPASMTSDENVASILYTCDP